MEKTVLVWQETILLPTYETGAPEKNPIFLEKRVYQGSSGSVYPHAVIEKIEDVKTEKAYTALFLENDFLKIMILPELGGRVHRAYDKIRKRDFVYYNQVIKPALVGLTGPWISGGIEFNWPQHHRPSTFLPVDFTIKENADGSKTVWVNEVELMFRTKCQAGFTLYPDKAYLEIKGKLFNRSALPQTFLWWANPAVKVNEHYQSVFPPDVHAVFDHGKRDVSDFPVATGTYYKVDYAPGTDISRYKNIPVPTSYMAIRSDYDFVGGYEHDTESGILHVANHHISPGKKQWTWGCGEFGQAWDRNLTDEDGPYIELMTGVFTDNQPDFSWLQPNEEKTFEQYFMPYYKVGMVKNATKEAMINVEVNGKEVHIIIYATGIFPNSDISVQDRKGNLLKKFTVNLSPAEVFETRFVLAEDYLPTDLSVTVATEKGKSLVSYEAIETEQEKEIPQAATPAKKPSDIQSIDELYLNGLHIEQYRHATYQATDYYKEALRREPNDSRCNNAMGLWLLRYGQFAKAEPYFRKAIKTITSRNPNPYDGEAYYNLGLSCWYQEKTEEAYQAFYKATWSDAWQHNSFLYLARIESARGNYTEALELVEKSLVRNYHSHSARHLKALLLRKLKNYIAAFDCVKESLEIDPFNYGCGFEWYLLYCEINEKTKATEQLHALRLLMRSASNNYIEYAFDYGNAGAYTEAIFLLHLLSDNEKTLSAMVYYCKSYFAGKCGMEPAELSYLSQAGNCNPDYCFPNKLEEIAVLQYAIKANPADDKAHYYLGNLWYGMRQYPEAISAFEKSIAINPSFPTAHRNLSLLSFNKEHHFAKATKAMERAFELDKQDARVLMELDQLYKRLNYSLTQRLDLLNRYEKVVAKRDDLYLQKITLENCTGNHAAAQRMLAERIFHPWEGGEGNVVGQYVFAQLSLAQKAILSGNYEQALELLGAAKAYPANLGEGKLDGARDNNIYYLEGCVYEALGLANEAREKFIRATEGTSKPVQAIFYNDPQPDQILYQGLAYLKQGNAEKAHDIFCGLINFGTNHFDDHIEIDYFAVSLPDLLVFDTDLDARNKNHCRYLMGLGELGLHNYEQAAIHLNKVLQDDCSHASSIFHLGMISFLEKQGHHFYQKQKSVQQV
jgi:tetratricopeptide (TPR) repeat protein